MVPYTILLRAWDLRGLQDKRSGATWGGASTEGFLPTHPVILQEDLMKIEGLPTEMTHKHVVTLSLDYETTADIKEIVQTIGVTAVCVASAVLVMKKVFA